MLSLFENYVNKYISKVYNICEEQNQAHKAQLRKDGMLDMDRVNSSSWKLDDM